MLHLSVAAGSMARPHLNEGAQFGDDFWVSTESSQLKSDMKKVIEGLAAYQNFPFERHESNAPIIYQDGSLCVRFFKPSAEVLARIIIIPSLINGWEILDLLPERSLTQFLTDQGYEVMIIDWGDLRNDPDYKSLTTLLDQKLHRAVTHCLHETRPNFALGYCMGGVLLAGYETLHPHQFDGHIYVATPWDFSQKTVGDLSDILSGWARDGLAKLGYLDVMPMEWLQMIFAAVDPDLIARKYAAFAAMDKDAFETKLFVAVEDWVNGGQDLPAPLLHHAVKHWYVENMPYRGNWQLGKVKVAAKNITVPSYVIVPQRDKIVPKHSAYALSQQLPQASVVAPDCGHISMMIGRHAREQVWEPLHAWIMRQCSMKKLSNHA
jgi:polyhydroxyalkanoate synthase subunit PhaC